MVSNRTIVEAAQSLGARWWTVLGRILIPMAAPGLTAGSVLIFVPVVGAFMEPRILGGPQGVTLGTVIEESLSKQIVVVSIIAILATVGVYGIVALIVRMDELGYKLIALSTKERSLSKTIGNILVQALPKVIKSLSVIGTIALILVAGGIFAHNIDFLHHLLPQWPSVLKEFGFGLLIGFLVLTIVKIFKKIVGKN